MSDEKLEPMTLWRDWFVKSEKAWSQALTDVMGDEKFSKGMGRYMQEALHTHRMFSEGMSQYLANLNLPSRSAHHASQLYGANVAALLKLLVKNGELAIDLGDEIIRETLVTHGGKVVNTRVIELMGQARIARRA